MAANDTDSETPRGEMVDDDTINRFLKGEFNGDNHSVKRPSREILGFGPVGDLDPKTTRIEVDAISTQSSDRRSVSDNQNPQTYSSTSQSTLFDNEKQVPEPVYIPNKPNQDPNGSSESPHAVFGARRDFHERLCRIAQFAKERSQSLQRPTWFQRTFQFTCYILLLCIVYFVFIGLPLWHGVMYELWFVYEEKLHLAAGWVIFLGISLVYAIVPLFSPFEKNLQMDEKEVAENAARAANTAIVIPCYRSEDVIGGTLAAALRTFPAENIFVVANGNSETPLDGTMEVCRQYGVRSIWMPVASKVVAQFVGVNAAYDFPYVIMMDDDCRLPENFPVVTDRLQYGFKGGQTKCVGYTLNSVGENGSTGSLCQQAQDIEYKLSGLQRNFWSRWGSASFAPGAMALWDREFLLDCFRHHPGYTITEDWYFGLVCRQLGGRIRMCSRVFVRTETPQRLVIPSKGIRGGYGEMTVTRQRMLRWNFFLVSRTWYNVKYILFSWKLGFLEIGTKLEVFREVYETLLLLSTPIILPISIAANPGFTIGVTFGIIFMYSLITVLFNEIHLRTKGAQVSRKTVILYYPVYKTYLRIINVVSCYVALFKYARYFRVRYPGIMENHRAMDAMLKLSQAQFEEDGTARRHANPEMPSPPHEQVYQRPPSGSSEYVVL